MSTGDLFGHAEPVREEPRVFSVSEITRSVRAVLEEEIGTVWVEGEVSNYRRQASGHQYFTLKDAQSQLACVWFARPALRLRQVPLSEGMQVQVRGALTVYEARGQYQLTVQLVQAGGAGLLQARFEALKRKLEAEGLFAAERKRALPTYPCTIALVTSPTGAALQDMLNILTRRAPWVRLLISPVRVQGLGAAEEVARAIAELNRAPGNGLPLAEVMVVSRGGGSVEDLWAFNEEVVARAIASSAIPVVSAVGHEIDFTIADFAADLRAPTPSAAAELIVPDGAILFRRVEQWSGQLARAALQAIRHARHRVEFLRRATLFREPEQRLGAAAQQLDSATEALHLAMTHALRSGRQRTADLAAGLRQHRPDQLLALRTQQFQTTRTRLEQRFRDGLRLRATRLAHAAEMLRLLAPAATLARGYSITRTRAGAVVDSVAKVSTANEIITHLHDGRLISRVEKIEESEPSR